VAVPVIFIWREGWGCDPRVYGQGPQKLKQFAHIAYRFSLTAETIKI